MANRLEILELGKEPQYKNVLWLKGTTLYKWGNDGWIPIGGWDKGTSNYNDLTNKPKINGVLLQGDVKLDLGTNVEVINNLTSDSASAALSANQGRVLNGKITENSAKITTLSDSLESKANSATTLKGYGITDAYTKIETNNAISNALQSYVVSLEDVYIVDIAAISSSDDYNNLKEAIRNSKVILQASGFNCIILNASIVTEDTEYIELYSTSLGVPNNGDCDIVASVYKINQDGTWSALMGGTTILSSGSGTKYLSDDGYYKEIIIPDVDLSNYYTKEEVNDAISNVEVDLSDYAKKDDIPSVEGFLTEIPEEYVTDEELEESLKDYAKSSEIVTYENATQETDGLMSAEDKTKLDSVTGLGVIKLTNEEYQALVAAGTASSDIIYVIVG